MKVLVDGDRILKIMSRHKARTLKTLEDIECPKGYLTIVKNSLDYLRSDLVDMASDPKTQG